MDCTAHHSARMTCHCKSGSSGRCKNFRCNKIRRDYRKPDKYCFCTRYQLDHYKCYWSSTVDQFHRTRRVDRCSCRCRSHSLSSNCNSRHHSTVGPVHRKRCNFRRCIPVMSWRRLGPVGNRLHPVCRRPDSFHPHSGRPRLGKNYYCSKFDPLIRTAQRN